MTSAETREGELPNASRNGTAPAGSEPEELDGLRISLRTYRRVVFVALLLLCAIVVTGTSRSPDRFRSGLLETGPTANQVSS
ncbi:MAG: hypothetical protein R2789_14075 [Microthrixaceae bacterium]